MKILDVGLNYGNMTYGNVPKCLIVHHIEAEGANWTVQMIHNMHKNENGWSAIGYHYYIRLDGSIYRGRPDNVIGAHCQGANTNTLGIAFEGDYDKRTEMPQDQFNAWCELKSYLINKYGSINVYGHREKGSSECPGKYFPLDKVKKGEIINNSGEWIQDNVGWWYKHSDGSYAKCDWEKIDGEWYYFDYKGYMCTGWVIVKGKDYYLYSNGQMVHDCELYGYRFDSNGVATKI
ncbi:MAG: N-acetylmuramoyl-L-alanine amidase [Clostridium butyricum]|nr:N-acetylmuramoyl-L-alanine amidase [Clostridium butyricum]